MNEDVSQLQQSPCQKSRTHFPGAIHNQPSKKRYSMSKIANWVDFWDSENLFDIYFDWQKFTDLFVTSTEPILHYTKSDRVLDIGSGPGCLAVCLKNTVKEIHCCDTSQKYLNHGKKKVGHQDNVFFYQLDKKEYTDLSFFKRKFTKIVCVSVVHYYDSVENVEDLIEEVRKIAQPGAYFLIADIVTDKSTLPNVAALLQHALKRRYVFRLLRTLYYLRKSAYGELLSTKGLLRIPVEKLHEIIDDHDLDAEILSMPLTTNLNRKHLLIRF